MQRTRQILAIGAILLGIALVVYGLVPDPWPISLQLILGICAIAYGYLRLRYF
jgi:hypothetical protein